MLCQTASRSTSTYRGVCTVIDQNSGFLGDRSDHCYKTHSLLTTIKICYKTTSSGGHRMNADLTALRCLAVALSRNGEAMPSRSTTRSGGRPECESPRSTAHVSNSGGAVLSYSCGRSCADNINDHKIGFPRNKCWLQ
jgi:hypothetical protein